MGFRSALAAVRQAEHAGGKFGHHGSRQRVFTCLYGAIATASIACAPVSTKPTKRTWGNAALPRLAPGLPKRPTLACVSGTSKVVPSDRHEPEPAIKRSRHQRLGQRLGGLLPESLERGDPESGPGLRNGGLARHPERLPSGPHPLQTLD